MAKSRVSKSWLEDYLKFVDNSESPKSYHKWAGLSLIAGALQRRVFMRRGHETIHPNMYIVLVGPSGLSRKGEPLRIAHSFLEQINVTVIPQSNSKESIIQDMHACETNFTDITSGRIMTQSAITCIAEEMGVFCGQQNIGLLLDMCEWYDSKPSFKYSTKNQGRYEINGVCFNFLSATDPSWLPSILPKEAVSGGFTSRIIFVVEERKRQTIANPNAFPVDERLRRQLLTELEIITTLTGEFRLSNEAQTRYEEWYTKEDRLWNEQKHGISDPFLAGYVSRRPTHLWKVCMCLAASRGNDRIVSIGDIEMGINYLEEIEPKMHQVFKGMGTTKYATETQTILDMVRKRRIVSKAEVMNRYERTIDSTVYDAAVDDLAARKLIRILLAPDRIELIEEKGGSIVKFIGG